MPYRTWFIASFLTPLFFRYHLPLSSPICFHLNRVVFGGRAPLLASSPFLQLAYVQMCNDRITYTLLLTIFITKPHLSRTPNNNTNK
jgi:hypothetical protein